MPYSFFITGSGTDIGKTKILCSLIYNLKQYGYSASAIKPIVTGYNDQQENDITQILKSYDKEYSQDNINKIAPWRFLEPLSPDMAARINHTQLIFNNIADFCYDYLYKATEDFAFIEGIGGVMTPVSEKKTILDLIKVLNIPAIVVVGSYLGALSHALTTIKVLEKFTIRIALVCVNQINDNDISLDETLITLKNFLPYQIVPIKKLENGQNYINFSNEVISHLKSFHYAGEYNI